MFSVAPSSPATRKIADMSAVRILPEKPYPNMESYPCVRSDRWKYIHYTDLTDMDDPSRHSSRCSKAN